MWLKKIKYLCLVLIAILYFEGCATPVQFKVSVNSINGGQQPLAEKKYYIASGMKDVSSDDLQFQEYVSYVKRAMVLKGFSHTDVDKDADVLVFLGYAISDPKENVYSYSTPVWGQTGVSSAQTFGTVHSFGSGASYSGTTTYTPSYGVVGSSSHVGTYDTYTRHIVLSAYDAKLYRESKKEKQLWKTEITSTGTNGDLRFVFPVLIAAATKYIGENTGKSIEMTLTEDSKEVLDIRGIVNDSSDKK